MLTLFVPFGSAFTVQPAFSHTTSAFTAPSTAMLRTPSPPLALLGISEEVETGDVPKTIGDAKTAFQNAYGRPVNAIQQGFVNEMISSVALTVSSPAYAPNRCFYLGFESLCKTFLEGSSSESEQEAIRSSLCAAFGFDAERLRKEAQALEAFAAGKSEAELLAMQDLAAISAAGGRFKYSYPLGAGLFALMPMASDVEEVTDEVIERWCAALQLPSKKLVKDYAFIVDASEKLVEVKQMMMEMSAAAKRKEAQKLKEEAEKAAKEADEAEAAAAASES